MKKMVSKVDGIVVTPVTQDKEGNRVIGGPIGINVGDVVDFDQELGTHHADDKKTVTLGECLAGWEDKFDPFVEPAKKAAPAKPQPDAAEAK